MKPSMRLLLSALVVCTFFAAVTDLSAARRSKAQPRTVGFFDAISQGLIEVKYIANDSFGGQMIIKNKTKEPLLIQKPFAFAGVPALSQFGPGELGMGGGMGGMGGMGGDMMGGDMGGGRGGRGSSNTTGGSTSGGGSQSVGGGMGGMGGGMGGMSGGMGGGMGGGRGGMGGGMFNIGPEKTIREKVRTVCLEHGKKEPNSRVEYAIQPISDFSDSKELGVLCAMIGTGQVNQNAGQAAAWHLSNNMSWDELAAKKSGPHLSGPKYVPYFSNEEMQTASFATQKVKEFVKANFDNEEGSTSERNK
ncbi:MAG: hypothetical protein ACRC2T_07975 [Thermoguttaceae bacterium]